MDRIVCCHSTSLAVKHEALYRCHGCDNLWHGSCFHKSCYTNGKNGRDGCCKDRSISAAFNNETILMMRNASKSYRDRQ